MNETELADYLGRDVLPLAKLVAHGFCRHCGYLIEQREGQDYWLSNDGMASCGKNLPHQPMPEGLRGEEVRA